MKKWKKALCLLTAMTCVMGFAVTAHAEDKYEGTQTPTDNLVEVKGGQVTFKKFLVVGAGDTIPNATFSYTIAAGAAISTDTSDNGVFQVDAGVMTGIVQPTSTTFAPTDTTYTSVQTDDIDVARAASDRVSTLTAATGVEFETSKGEKYAVQTSTIDFRNVTFVEPGIYRYIITETADTGHDAAGIMHDNDTTRVLDVYVTDDGFGKLEVSASVLHKGAGSTGAWIDNPDVKIGSDMGSDDVAAGDSLSDKTDGFTNEYKSVDLAVKKEVSGNQASRDKYFKLTVKVPGLTAGDEYTVSLADDGNANTNDGKADGTSGTNNATIGANANQTNKTKVTGSELGTGVDFYLQHGQHIVIRGLPQNATYTVTENAEDYKFEEAGVTGYKNAATGKLSEKDVLDDNNGSTAVAADGIVRTSFLNTRNGIIPTGILTVMGPAVAIIVLALAGFGVLLIGKRRKAGKAK